MEITDINNALDKIATEICSTTDVIDCALLIKKDINNISSVIIYLAATKPVKEHELLAIPLIQALEMPIYFVAVTCIPRTNDGAIKTELLEKLPVINHRVIEHLSKIISEHPAIDEVTLKIKSSLKQVTPWHFSDIANHVDLNFNKGIQPLLKSNDYLKENVNKDTPLAYIHGNPLLLEKVPLTLTSALIETSKCHPKNGIFYINENHEELFQSYPQLLEEASVLLSYLLEKGCLARNCIILNIENLKDHITTFWACLLGGFIPVTIAVPTKFDDEDSVAKKLKNIWQFLNFPQIACESGYTQELAHFLGPIAKLVPINNDQDYQPCLNYYSYEPDEVLFYQATSGSTGVPKLVQITNKGIVAHINGAQDNYQNTSVTLNWLPHDHVAPLLSYHLRDTYLGSNQVKVPTNNILSSPLNWLRYIERYQVTHSWSPNFGYKLVCEALKKSPHDKFELASLKCLMNGGEQITYQVIDEFTSLLKKHGLKKGVVTPAYGMAETCTAITYCTELVDKNISDLSPGIDPNALRNGYIKTTKENTSESLQLVSVGTPNKGIALRIVNESNEILPELSIGRLQIKGDVVTPGYLNNPTANTESFTDGWYNGGDLGFIYKGRLTITGREKESIIIRGANFFCYEIEEIVSRIDGVLPTFCAACAVHNITEGIDRLVIFFVPSREIRIESMYKDINTALSKHIGITADYIIPLQKDEFPKTTSGKIQRLALTKKFLNGDFDSICKEIDCLLENNNTLPKWFYKKIWQSFPIRQSDDNANLKPLIFINKKNRHFVENLNKEVECIFVFLGSKFNIINQNSIEIDIYDFETYKRLFIYLLENKTSVSHILHFGSCDINSSSDINIEKIKNAHFYGLWSIIYILKEATQSKFIAQDKIRMSIFSSQSLEFSENESLNLNNIGLPAILDSINTEFPSLKVNYIDFSLEDLLSEQLSSYIKNEINARIINKVVKYQNGNRYIPALHKIDFDLTSETILKVNGLYIITGGLGGIGIHICQYLHAKYKAKLVIIGKTPITNFDEHQYASYNLLKNINCEFHYYNGDILDTQFLKDITLHIQELKQQLSGVIHLAGSYQENLLIDETNTSFENSFHTKVYSTLLLHQLLSDLNSSGVFISFSSLTGNFGGAMLGSYAVANRFLESFSHYQRKHSDIRGYSLSWSNWHNTGMSAGYNAMRSKGFMEISIARGVASFGLALASPGPLILIGLDNKNNFIQAITNSDPCPINKIEIFYKTNEANYQIDEKSYFDPFGTKLPLEFFPIQQASYQNSKDILLDNKNLENNDGLDVVNASINAKISHLWTSILQIEEITLDDGFFEIGGNSLLIIQLQSKINDDFNISLKLKDLINHPTIRKQACLINDRLSMS